MKHIKTDELPIELQWHEQRRIERRDELADWVTAFVCGTVALTVCVPRINMMADSVLGLGAAPGNSSKPKASPMPPGQPFTGKLTANQTRPIIAFMKVGSSYTNGRVYFPCQTGTLKDCTIHPITGKVSSHKGVDIVSAYGQTQYAIGIPGQGKVQVTCRVQPGGAGNYADMLQPSTGADTQTMHLTTCNGPVGKMFEVEPGQPIGTTGTTGSSTGPHIHLAQFVNGKHVNPQLWTAVMLIDGKLPPP